MSERRRPPDANRSGSSDQRGASTVGTVTGVAVFLVLLLFALQVLVVLHTTSTIVGATQDAARRVASMRIDHDDPAARASAVRESDRQLRELLGEVGRDASIDWTFEDDAVRVRIVADTPAILPSGIRDSAGLRRIDRTVRVQIERGPR